MRNRILQTLSIFLITGFLSLSNQGNLSINSINALRNQDKEIYINFNEKQIKVDIKTLRNKSKLSNKLNRTLLKGYNLDDKIQPKVIKEKGRYKAVKGKVKTSIDMNHLVLASLISDSVDLKIKEENTDFTFEKANNLADKLNKVKNQKLRVHTNGESQVENIDILTLFKNGTDEIDKNALSSFLSKYEEKHSLENLVSNVYINSNTGESNGFLKDGRKINIDQTAQNLLENIERGLLRIQIQYDTLKAMVIDENSKEYRYEKQGEGKSNFKGSDWGRSQNVELGTKNLISSVFVMPGQQISFLNLLKNKGSNISWKLAKVIKEGGKLELEPGGGLCQVSTTLFRAALQSGMNIDQWRNHSLYVSYYKEYNNGLDSTIYPPYVDLKFTNPYNFPVLFQSYTNENKDVITEIYSPKAIDKVELIGPFYQGDLPGLRSNQILWQRKTSRFMHTQTEDYLSTYNTSVSR